MWEKSQQLPLHESEDLEIGLTHLQPLFISVGITFVRTVPSVIYGLIRCTEGIKNGYVTSWVALTEWDQCMLRANCPSMTVWVWDVPIIIKHPRYFCGCSASLHPSILTSLWLYAVTKITFGKFGCITLSVPPAPASIGLSAPWFGLTKILQHEISLAFRRPLRCSRFLPHWMTCVSGTWLWGRPQPRCWL